MVHGLRITHAVSEYPESARRRGGSEQGVVRLHFGLSGKYGVRYPQLHRSFEHLQAHYSLFYAQPFELEFVNESPRLETFGVQFSLADFESYAGAANDTVARFCERAANGHSGFLFEPSGSLPLPMEQIIRCMLDTRYAGALEQTYLLSQSLELLVRVLDHGSRQMLPDPPFVKTRADRDKLFAARDLIDGRLDDPPTLAQVGKQVGLNEYKLKRGFKELFGKTVFSYLTGQRLELAFQMLLGTERSSAEVAFALGYKTPQHFSEAFKKHFGLTPKAVRKNP
jgi:AraC family transcriptional regulator, transcriptional activator of the genes for pyochelin and ferripyochelin receptors